MVDPLDVRYRDSFNFKRNDRMASFPLPAALVARLIQNILSTGAHPGIPPLLLDRWKPDRAIFTDPASQAPISVPPAPIMRRSTATLHAGIDALDAAAGRSYRDAAWLSEQAEYEILWKLYEEMVAEEYALINVPKSPWWAAMHFFNEKEKKKAGSGLLHYKKLRPVYYRWNVKEPHELIMRMRSGVKFAGVNVLQGVHPEFAKSLAKADESLNRSLPSEFGSVPVLRIGCYRPSTLPPRPGSKLENISNHMLGAAIDIDPTRGGEDANPHLKGAKVIALDAVLAFTAKNPLRPPGPPLKASGSWLASIPKDATPEDRARKLHNEVLAISLETRAFLDNYLKGWLAASGQVPQSTPLDDQEKLRQEAFALITKLALAFGGLSRKPKAPLENTAGVRALRNIQANGFVSIPADIFVALLDAGLQSGGEYKGTKDIMHFEVKSSRAFIASPDFL